MESFLILAQMMLQQLQKYLIITAIRYRTEVEQMPISTSLEIRLTLFLPRKEWGDQTQESQSRLDQRKQHAPLRSSESNSPIVGFNNPEHVAQRLLGVEIHSGTEDHELDYLMGVDQGTEVD